MRLVITQSNYIPWKGFFDLIAKADKCLLYDTVQYTKQDWRNRNQIKTAQGLLWLTIPVKQAAVNTSIGAIEIADGRWAIRHLRLWKEHYRKAAYFDAVWPKVEALYLQAADMRLLSDVNMLCLRRICELLGIKTVLEFAPNLAGSGDKNMDLIALCKREGALHYVVGPKAKSYLNEGVFAAHGVQVEWMDYEGYRPYTQAHPPFCHHVSVLDLLFNTGANARDYLLCGGGGA